MSTNNQNRRGQRLTGTILGSSKMRKAIEEMVNCFYSPKLTVKSRAADGSTTISESEIKMGPLGWTTEIDLTDAGLGGTSFETIIPGCFYNILNTTTAADTWKTFQMRDFIFGGRSKWKTDSAYNNFATNGETATNGGNFEIKMALINDLARYAVDFFAQPTALTTQGTIAATTDTVIFDPTIATGGTGTFGQIVLNDSVTNGGGMVASFWLEIIDDPVLGYYARVMARMSGAAGQPAASFPTSADNIIPLCIINANKNSQEFAIVPIQTGNLVNRYPPGTMTTRGDWTADALTGQYFFPGDLVTNGAATLDSSLKKTYIRKTFGFTSTAPAGGADWTALIS